MEKITIKRLLLISNRLIISFALVNLIIGDRTPIALINGLVLIYTFCMVLIEILLIMILWRQFVIRLENISIVTMIINIVQILIFLNILITVLNKVA